MKAAELNPKGIPAVVQLIQMYLSTWIGEIAWIMIILLLLTLYSKVHPRHAMQIRKKDSFNLRLPRKHT